jgi:hypothetical protein
MRSMLDARAVLTMRSAPVQPPSGAIFPSICQSGAPGSVPTPSNILREQPRNRPNEQIMLPSLWTVVLLVPHAVCSSVAAGEPCPQWPHPDH